MFRVERHGWIKYSLERRITNKSLKKILQMFLIPPPAGVPVSTVPQILRLANKSQRTAPLVVNYFRVDGDAFVKTQLQRGHASDVTVDNGELKMFDAK